MEIPITIRQATLLDLDEMLAIEEANFSSEEAVSRQSLEESIRKSAGTFLVARDENQLLGYILGGPYPHNPKCLEIHSLVIEADHQRQGLGTLLLAALKQVTVELDYQGILLQSPDELLSYFEMNGFVEEEVTGIQYDSGSEWNLTWVNPFYQEEV